MGLYEERVSVLNYAAVFSIKSFFW